MPNKLQTEKSPYLLQHSKQEIEWMTWGPQALKKATQSNKPLLISIGYSACHWCQTMSRQNFEDNYISTLMNRHFVCVLVDREERPDLDQFYMEAIRMFNQSAGWPLHAFCLPTGEPFWGGTFFPKEDIGQEIAPWPQVLIRISEHFRTHPEELVENAKNVMKNLLHTNHPEFSSSDSWSPSLLIDAIDKICDLHDEKYGGFTPAPKFPPSMKIDFLVAAMESDYVKQNSIISEKINRCIVTTLDNMANGGIFDQVEGGFFRYSVDAKWAVPHFEKMMLENSLLLATYARAFRTYRLPQYQRVVQKTLTWLLKNMGSPTKGFATSVSAESENVEGKYYVWTKPELIEILGEKTATPWMEKLELINGGDEPLFHPCLTDDNSLNAQIDKNILPRLEQARSDRKPPAVDKKRMASTNAVLIQSLINASIAMKDKALLEKACELADWMKAELLEKQHIYPIAYPGNPKAIQTSELLLDDFVFWAESLLALAAVSEFVRPQSSAKYVADAIASIEQCISLFRDEKVTGFFLSSSGAKAPPPIRKKYWYDNASPSGNSALLRVFSQLHVMTKDKRWKEEYRDARSAYLNIAKKNPEAISYALTAITEESVGIVEVTAPSQAMDEIFNILGEYPHRPTLFKFTGQGTTITLQVKEHGEEVSSPKALMERLYA